jgi:hypothetical protein
VSSSPSTGTRGPPAPSPPGGLPRPDARLLLKLLGAFLAALALWFLLRRPYSRLIVHAGAQVLSLLAGRGADEIIIERGPDLYLDSGIARDDGTPARFQLHVNPVSWNGVLFAALIAATPLRLLKRRRGYVLGAAILLAASHVGYFTFSTFTMVATAYEQAGLGFVDPRLLRALGVATQVYANMFAIALPFLLYAPVLLWRTRLAARRLPPGHAPPRNAPCPCGSGLKWKRCCGR